MKTDLTLSLLWDGAIIPVSVLWIYVGMGNGSLLILNRPIPEVMEYYENQALEILRHFMVGLGLGVLMFSHAFLDSCFYAKCVMKN